MIEIGAPAERVFEFFSHPENYLRISDTIKHVEIFGDGRYAKEMMIAGIPVHFEERFVRSEKPRLIETHSEPSSAMHYCKQLRFEDLSDNRTRLHLQFRYRPVAGALGHAAASLLGIDPKSMLTDLLMRAKYFLETGREPRDATGRRREQAHASGQKGSATTSPPDRSLPAVPHGPGAPAGDVHGPGVNEAAQGPAWPAASSPTTQPTGAASAFPPTG